MQWQPSLGFLILKNRFTDSSYPKIYVSKKLWHIITDKRCFSVFGSPAAVLIATHHSKQGWDRWETSSGGKRRGRKKAMGGERRRVMSTGRALTHAQVKKWWQEGKLGSVSPCTSVRSDKRRQKRGEHGTEYLSNVWTKEGGGRGKKVRNLLGQRSRVRGERKSGHMASLQETRAELIDRGRGDLEHIWSSGRVITRRIHSTCFKTQVLLYTHAEEKHCFIATASFSLSPLVSYTAAFLSFLSCLYLISSVIK